MFWQKRICWLLFSSSRKNHFTNGNRQGLDYFPRFIYTLNPQCPPPQSNVIDKSRKVWALPFESHFPFSIVFRHNTLSGGLYKDTPHWAFLVNSAVIYGPKVHFWKKKHYFPLTQIYKGQKWFHKRFLRLWGWSNSFQISSYF